MECSCKFVVYCIWWKLGFGELYRNSRYFFLICFAKLAAGWKQNPLNWKCLCNSSENISQVPEPQADSQRRKHAFSLQGFAVPQRGQHLQGTHSTQLPFLSLGPHSGRQFPSYHCSPGIWVCSPSLSTTTPSWHQSHPGWAALVPSLSHIPPLMQSFPQWLTVAELRVTHKADWKLLLGWNLCSLGFNTSRDFFLWWNLQILNKSIKWQCKLFLWRAAVLPRHF